MVEYPLPCPCSDTPQLSCHTTNNGDSDSLTEGHPPYNVHSPCPHFGVTAHDGDAGSEGAIDAEHDGLGATGHHSQVSLGIAVVPPAKTEVEVVARWWLCCRASRCSSAKRAAGGAEVRPHLTTMRTG